MKGERGRWDRLWLAYLGCGLLATTHYFALPTAGVKSLWYDVVALATVVAIVVGVRLHRPAGRAPWCFLALSVALAVGGDLTWTYNQNFLGVALPFPSAGDLLYLSSYLALFAGVLLLVPTRSTRDTRAATIDVAIATLGGIILIWTFLIAPVMADSSRPLLDRLLASAYPGVDLLVLVSVLRLMLTLERRTTTLHLLVLALSATFVADVAYALLVARDGYSTGHPIDAGWLIAYVLYGALALHPSMREQPRLVAGSVGMSPARFVLLASAALVGPGMLAYQTLRGRAVDVPLIATVSAILFLLALARSDLLARELRGREAHFRALVQHSSDIVAVIDVDGTLREISPLRRNILGHDLSTHIGRSLRGLLHPDDAVAAFAALARLGARHDHAAPFELRLRDGAGQWRVIEVIATNLLGDPNVGGIVLNCRDITARRRAEAALRASESGLATAQRIARLGDWSWDEACGAMRWSDELYRLLGHEPGAVSPHLNHFLRMVHPADRDRVRRWTQEVYAGQAANLQHRLLLPDGTTRIVQHRAQVIAHPARTGRARHLAGTLLDATEHARIDAAQRLLARAGALLASPLDLAATLETIAALVVPALGDWCVVDLQRADGTIERSLVRHADPAHAAAARTLTGHRHESASVGERVSRARSLRDSASALAGDLADAPERRADYAALGIGAYMVAPIEARARPIGVLTVVSADPTHRYDEYDLGLLVDLAGRAGLALDNLSLRLALGDHERELRDLVRQLLFAQEEERRRVAYDIHDGLAQLLTGAYQQLQAYEYRYQPRPVVEQHDLEAVLSATAQAVQEARRIIANLRPTALDDFGLGVAIRRQAESLRTQGWQITYSDGTHGERFPPQIETALYRIAQEALNNIRKHATTANAWIEIERDGQTITLRVYDDGVGMPVGDRHGTAEEGEHIGLRGMRERVDLLGGVLQVTSEPGHGTRIAATVPLPRV